MLFGRLLQLLTNGYRVVLVFDAKSLPPAKRDQATTGRGGVVELERRFRRLAAALGVGSRTAAGEAEAELAMLYKEGHIDAVMDVRAFPSRKRTLRGAKRC